MLEKAYYLRNNVVLSLGVADRGKLPSQQEHPREYSDNYLVEARIKVKVGPLHKKDLAEATKSEC